MAKNRKIFKLKVRREYWSKCKVLYINGFVSTSSTNWWKAFFKFWNHFSNILQFFLNIIFFFLHAWRGEFVLISTRSISKCIWEYIPKYILSVPRSYKYIPEIYCTYHELYKLMESFFQNFEFVFELLAENWEIF